MPTGESLGTFNKLRAKIYHEEQLKSYVIRSSGCWEWTRSTSPDGYGKLKRNGITLRAHRVFYEHFKGPIVDNMHVLHKCDNPLCVNPDHLFLGTHSDNMQDMNNKNRRGLHASISKPESIIRGEKHHRFGKGMPEQTKSALLKANVGRKLTLDHKEKLSPLTREQVMAIREDNRSQWVIAKEYNVCQMTICRIKRRERWKDL